MKKYGRQSLRPGTSRKTRRCQAVVHTLLITGSFSSNSSSSFYPPRQYIIRSRGVRRQIDRDTANQSALMGPVTDLYGDKPDYGKGDSVNPLGTWCNNKKGLVCHPIHTRVSMGILTTSGNGIGSFSEAQLGTL